jgi:hypothetical protein
MHDLIIYAEIFFSWEWCEIHKRQPLAGCLACLLIGTVTLKYIATLVEQLGEENGVGLCFCTRSNIINSAA